MYQSLVNVDRLLFIGINNLPHNEILNSFFAFLSGIGTAGIIWVIIAIILLVFEEIKDKLRFISLLLALFISYFSVDVFLKNIIRRPRPSLELFPTLIEVFGKSTSYSFPSGHATLAFAGAYILAKRHKARAGLYYLLAFLIAFSRIYLGKHYPSDVLVGAVLGTMIGYLSLRIGQLIYFDMTKKDDSNH